MALLEELSAYPGGEAFAAENLEPAILVPMRIRCPLGLLSFMSTITRPGKVADEVSVEVCT